MRLWNFFTEKPCTSELNFNSALPQFGPLYSIEYLTHMRWEVKKLWEECDEVLLEFVRDLW